PLARAKADLGAVDAGDAGLQHRLDRRRVMPVEAGIGGVRVGAEAQHDAFLVGQHAVEGAPHPQDDDQREDDREAGAGAKAAGKDTAQTILAAAQDLFEVGRLRSARPARAAAMAVAATPAAPGTAIAAATAAAR